MSNIPARAISAKIVIVLNLVRSRTRHISKPDVSTISAWWTDSLVYLDCIYTMALRRATRTNKRLRFVCHGRGGGASEEPGCTTSLCPMSTQTLQAG